MISRGKIRLRPNVGAEKCDIRTMAMMSMLSGVGMMDCGDDSGFSPPLKDLSMFPWNWGENAAQIELLSPSPPKYSDENNHHNRHDKNAATLDNGRRGRPRADAITTLIIEGATSPSSIKCGICNRVFPRLKSLQAHTRTHTGERPYTCDYPGCEKAFAQSGQLRTHQRLHTGEKPFVCTAPGCNSRFTHSNRHCPDHPYYSLQRDCNPDLKPSAQNTENSREIMQWLEKFRRERDEKPPTKTRESRNLKRQLDMQQSDDDCKKEKIRAKCVSIEANCPDEMLGAMALMQLAGSSELHHYGFAHQNSMHGNYLS